jgi:Tol biopolymer transport system component
MKKTQSFVFLILFLGLLISCGVFDNEQVPECLKSTSEQSPDILTCYNPLYFERPAWHPNGDWIAAEHSDSVDTNNDGLKDTLFSGIWLVNANNGQTQPLLPFGNAPAWNPLGTHLAVHAGGNIYTIHITAISPANYDSSSITLLTPFDASAFFPTWSDDGQWIAFDTNYLDSEGANVIWKTRTDGSDLTDISIHQVGEWRYANWNGQLIAHSRYVSERAIGPEIFIMKEDGKHSSQLTNSGRNYNPKFSPDGRKIGYEHHAEGLSIALWVMNSDGSDKRRIAKNWSSDMAWSPDGKKIVYVFSNQYYDVPGNGQLWIMNKDGGGKRQLTNYTPIHP